MRLRSVMIALAVTAIAIPVLAQPKQRDHRKKPDKEDKQPPPKAEIAVTGFAPQSGKVGTKVTISGRGFIKQDKVLVGGRPVKEDSMSDTAIVISIPARFGDGVITVRHPGAANDVVVGTFTVIADPEIRSFAPTTGAWGTRVEIKGAGFMNGDQVQFNGKALAIAEMGADRLVVVIPQGSTTDYFTVSRAGGIAARSKGQFKVVLPAPQISSIAPTSGPPGTTVRINGINFAADDRVFYGRAELQVNARTDSTLDVTIPANATKSDNLVVKGPRGVATTTQPFALVLDPVVTRFNPQWGPANTRVEIMGAHFMQSDQVWMNGRAIRIVAYEEAKLTVEIPAGAKSDLFHIYRGGKELAASKGTFEVIIAPVVSGFSPAGGAVGTRVIITGAGFSSDAKVLYGAQTLRVLARTADTGLEVAIPGGATDQPFVVETRGGQAQSARAFQVHTYSVVTSISPSRGAAGTRVTIGGRNFNGNDLFFLGKVSLAVVEKGANSYVVTIPGTAETGVIEWESFGNRQTSKFKFEIVKPPTLTTFTPTAGPAGTQVTLTGTDFANTTSVFFGNQPCQIVRRNLPTTLMVVIPAQASGTDYMWIEEAGKRMKSAQTFEVIAPPVFSAFAPATGPVGSKVVITGANFSNNTKVYFGTGGQPAVIAAARIPSQLTVIVPAGTVGAQWIWIEDRGQKIKSTSQFTVVLSPVITSMSPLTGPVGTQVTITGENFAPTSAVWLGNIQCDVVKRVRKTGLIVSIPAGAAVGKAYFIVDSDGQKIQSGQMFEVTKAPDPPPETDNHHEHAHEHPHAADDHHHHPHAHPHRPGAKHHHPF